MGTKGDNEFDSSPTEVISLEVTSLASALELNTRNMANKAILLPETINNECFRNHISLLFRILDKFRASINIIGYQVYVKWDCKLCTKAVNP